MHGTAVWFGPFFRLSVINNQTCHDYGGYVISVIMRPSSLGGGRILRRTLSVRLSVRPSRYRYRASRRATANYNDTHVLFGTR